MELKSKFSGKSIAALAFQALTDHNGVIAIWNWMKKLKLRPNVELFWWRLYNDAIPSNDFLFIRRLSIFSGCPRGCEEDENGCHIAGKCGKLRDVISILNSWGFKVPFFANLHECLEGLKMLFGKNSFIANMYCITTWLVWKSRCKLIHDGIEDSLNSLAANVVSTATEWMFEAQGIINQGDNFNIIKLLQSAMRTWKSKGESVRDCSKDDSYYWSVNASLGVQRFTQVVTSFNALGMELMNAEMVNKILYYLHTIYDAKITAIIESKDLNIYSIDNLLGLLITYEQEVSQRKIDTGEPRREKNIALKRKQKRCQHWNRGKFNRNAKVSNDVICYECKKPGHIKTECPKLKATPNKEKVEEKPIVKKGKKNFQRAFEADSASDSSETEKEEINITPLLSIMTFLIMSKEPIDEAQLILDYLYGLSDIGHVEHKRKKNIALGHLVAYILDKKYNLVHPDQELEEVLY
ncbi:hypothetical protein KFK09_024022 [Dendrobium nobile]|uniref:CCHC-type domain-containing protein n=1 Tax=Dendrobium nobile TaxID=94219 RepID=A0A8T3AI42_DENNO|nr:hypothetical protein KFK09_024022 [Dendrobium nobile]